jgi:hypothetical protein
MYPCLYRGNVAPHLCLCISSDLTGAPASHNALQKRNMGEPLALHAPSIERIILKKFFVSVHRCGLPQCHERDIFPLVKFGALRHGNVRYRFVRLTTMTP